MNKPSYENYRQYLGALALMLGAFASFSPVEASAADAIEVHAAAKQELQAISTKVANDDTQMSNWDNAWDNVAWPESTWTQIIIPPGFPRVAAAGGERLADILAEIA